jgi:hypothetical protein
MERKQVTERELISLLNEELRNYEECNNCQFTSIMKLREHDSTGCNWSSANVRCSGVPGEICRPFAERVIAKAKTKYNVKKMTE